MIDLTSTGETVVSLKYSHTMKDFLTWCKELGSNNARLSIKLIKAQDLVSKNSETSIDPYAIVLINNEEVYKTNRCKDTKDPQWTTKSSVLRLEDRHRSLTIRVYDYNFIGSDELLGEVSIPLFWFCHGRQVESWFVLHLNDWYCLNDEAKSTQWGTHFNMVQNRNGLVGSHKGRVLMQVQLLTNVSIPEEPDILLPAHVVLDVKEKFGASKVLCVKTPLSLWNGCTLPLQIAVVDPWDPTCNPYNPAYSAILPPVSEEGRQVSTDDYYLPLNLIHRAVVYVRPLRKQVELSSSHKSSLVGLKSSQDELLDSSFQWRCVLDMASLPLTLKVEKTARFLQNIGDRDAWEPGIVHSAEFECNSEYTESDLLSYSFLMEISRKLLDNRENGVQERDQTDDILLPVMYTIGFYPRLVIENLLPFGKSVYNVLYKRIFD